MATFPDLYKGEGLIRTYELLSTLTSDVQKDLEYLQKNKEAQNLRRNFVRSTFSFIDGIIQVLKFELKTDIRQENVKSNLTKSESEILYEVRMVNEKKIAWNIPTETNLKKTISITTKVWDLRKDIIDFSSNKYNSFLISKNTRNKLTHPRTYYDLEVSFEEVEQVRITFEWLKEGFAEIMKERIDSMQLTLPDDFITRFRIEGLKVYLR